MSLVSFTIRHHLRLQRLCVALVILAFGAIVVCVAGGLVLARQNAAARAAFDALPHLTSPSQTTVELAAGDQPLWMQRSTDAPFDPQKKTMLLIRNAATGTIIPISVAERARTIVFRGRGDAIDRGGKLIIPTSGNYQVSIAGEPGRTVVIGNADILNSPGRSSIANTFRTGWRIALVALFFLVIGYRMLARMAPVPVSTPEPDDAPPIDLTTPPLLDEPESEIDVREETSTPGRASTERS